MILFLTIRCPIPLVTLLLASVMAAADYPTIGNVPYAPYPETVVDIIQPAPAALTDRPVVQFVHGKRPGSIAKGDLLKLYTPFLEKGFVVVFVEYRFDSSEEDVQAAVKWIQGHASRYKLDPKRLVMVGVVEGTGLVMEAGPAAAFIGIDPPEAPEARKNLLVIHGEPGPAVFKWLKKLKLP